MKHTGITRRVLSMGLAIVFLSALCIGAAAWFSNMNTYKLPFAPGKLEDTPTMSMSRVAVGGQEASRAEFGEAIPASADLTNRAYGLGALWTQSNGEYALAIENMTFGVVDNISHHKPENIVYCKIAIPKSLGNTVVLDLAFLKNEENGQTGVNLYTKSIDAATWVKNETLRNTMMEHIQSSFLQYSYVLCATDYGAKALVAAVDAGTVTFSAPSPFEDDAPVTLTLPAADFDSEDSTVYYLYVKLVPNLSAYTDTFEDLAGVMPCYMDFGVDMQIEIYMAAQP